MLKLEYKGLTVPDFTALPPASQEYLIEYGWKQAMADAHAGSMKKVEKAFAEAGNEAEATPDNPQFLAEVETQIAADCQKRFDKILEGTMSVRDSDPLRAIAVEMLRKNAASKGTKLPDGKSDAYRQLVASVLEKHRGAIQKEYDRRQKTTIAIEL